MARSYGSAATLLVLKEAGYGVKPPGNWEKFSFVSSDIGAEQNLLASELLGQGREPRAPFRDVINDEGNIVVPVEARDFGRWLQFLLGNPVSAGVAAMGDITFTANPSAGHTITINGVIWTFVASGATAAQTNIGANLNATLTQLATDLNASVNASITPVTYANVGGTKLGFTHDTLGAVGNNFTIASGHANAVVSGATLSGGGYTHTFVSGAGTLPSFAAEIGHSNVPAYFVHTGCMLNSMAFNFQRSGAASATLNILAQGETRFTSSQGGIPTSRVYKPFSQFNGAVKRNNVALGNVTGAQFTYSNGMQGVPTIRSDGLIEAVDPTLITVNGNIEVRFADTLLVDDAIANNAIELELAYKMAGLDGNNFALTWTFHEVFLPRPRIPISGPGGVQASFNWQGVYDDALGKSTTVVLKNDVVSYP
ncbi:MAG: phage tail tube protein [Alphaproteobacteria bacterium]